MKNLRYLVMLMAAMLMAACNKTGQDPEEPQGGASGFKIEVFDMNSSHCKVLVVVNAAGADGRYDLANCILCPIGGVVTYDYK